MEKIFTYILFVMLLASCSKFGNTHQDTTRSERLKLLRDDSLALKVATSPTIDCLPLFLAKEKKLFDTLGVDVRLRCYLAQMDCDTAIRGGSVEGVVSDLVRTQRLAREGTRLQYITATGGYWQLLGNRRSRVARLDQLGDKIIAMTRFSATDWLSETSLAGVKTKGQVFKVQINDVNVRLRMLLNNEIDGAWLPEPYATMARLQQHKVLADSRNQLVTLGVVAFRQQALKDKRRQQQLVTFVKAYNMACDSLNRYGIPHYLDIMQKYYSADKRVVDALPRMHFMHAAAPGRHNMDKLSPFVSTTLVHTY